jgi:undecaprenyl pyrophosphate synthase
MTTRTLIFGQRSNLSRHLHKAITNSELISTKDILLKTNPMIKYAECKDISIIINSFYPAKLLQLNLQIFQL